VEYNNDNNNTELMEMTDRRTEKTTDSKYIQQHLANERTFLAWIRTGIAMIGLGFLAAGIVFKATPYSLLSHTIAFIVGIGSVLHGCFIITFATRDYFTKQEGINTETFRSPKKMIFFFFAALTFVNVFLLILVVLLLLF
jgi:putative membrane protein